MSDVTNTPELNTSAIAADVVTGDQSRVLQQTSLFAGSEADSEALAAQVDWDHRGQVVRSKFSDGHICQFRYDEAGKLYGFIYAKLAWSSNDGYSWCAQDTTNSYVTKARMSVNIDGTLSIERDAFTRTLRLNGLIVDDYRDGRVLETMRDDCEQKPADLLAEVIKKNGPSTTQDFSIPMSQVSAKEAGSGFSERSFAGDDQRAPDFERANGVDCPDNSTSLVQRARMKGFLPPSSLVADAESEAGLNDGAASTANGGAAAAAVSTRRPLAVGKRMNRLRVLDEKVPEQQASATAPSNSPKNSVRLAIEELRLSALERVFAPDHISLAPILDVLAEMFYERRRVNDAREAHERALAIRTTYLGGDHADVSINLYGLGRIYHEWGRYTEAEEQYAKAIRVSGKGLQKARFMRESGITDDAHMLEHIRRLLVSVHALAKLYSEQQRRSLCVELLETATNIRDSIDSCYHKHFEYVFESLAALASPDHEDSRNAPAAYMRKSKTLSTVRA